MEKLNTITPRACPHSAARRAARALLQQMSGIVAKQANVFMAFADVFVLLTLLFLSLAVVLPFVRKPSTGMGGGGRSLTAPATGLSRRRPRTIRPRRRCP